MFEPESASLAINIPQGCRGTASTALSCWRIRRWSLWTSPQLWQPRCSPAHRHGSSSLAWSSVPCAPVLSCCCCPPSCRRGGKTHLSLRLWWHSHLNLVFRAPQTLHIFASTQLLAACIHCSWLAGIWAGAKMLGTVWGSLRTELRNTGDQCQLFAYKT